MKFVAAGSFSASISSETSKKSDLFLWGSGAFGEFLAPHRVKKIRGSPVQVSIGDGFGMALTKKGNVYSWGVNHCGQLGSGDNETQPTPVLMQNLDDRKVTQIACGCSFVIALGQTLISTGSEDAVIDITQ